MLILIVSTKYTSLHLQIIISHHLCTHSVWLRGKLNIIVRGITNESDRKVTHTAKLGSSDV